MSNLQLSPQRLAELNRFAKRLNISKEQARQAFKERRQIPAFAEEYIKNKDLEGISEEEKYPLWTEYQKLTGTGIGSWD